MAEQIPYGVASSLIVRLASAAFHEFGRIYGVVDELERLKTTIESIKAVLLDAEEKQEQDHAVQIWIRRLKDVLHPADDLLDEFAIKDMRHKVDAGHKSKVKEVFHSISPNRVAFRYKMARKIEKIQKNFNDVAQDMAKLNLSPRVVVVNQSDSVRRETSSFVPESRIIGRGDSKKEIIRLLRQPNNSQNVSSIAIVGIGGLGKTALAQLVYNDVEVQNFFEKRAWISVSDNFDVKTIVKKMLEPLMNSKDDGTKLDKLLLEKLSLDSLQNKLREILNDKRYLLVLDDIWNENLEKWTELETYLMCGAQDSKVLVTTRNETVTQTMGVSTPHVLNGLTPEESWSLLKNITFGNDAVGKHLESIGKKIAEKCRGVPLAIKTLGGLLQSKTDESEWINVFQGDFWKLCKDENSIIPVLKLSYQNLSPQLRQCFAYCSLYPKDWEIEKDELIQLWIAQGYLECSTENLLMEDVGNQFVKTFLMKSFFQDAKMTEHGEIVSFKMHDLMHDLAMLVAGNDCCYLNGEAKTLVGRPMHVSFEPNAVHLLGSLDTSRLRTLILLSSNENKVYVEELFSVVSNFTCLRVLNLPLSSLRKLPDSIGKLKHLRYLNLSNCDQLASLSKCIGTLVCLQTLKLDMPLQPEFPTEVVPKLFNLRHLHIHGFKLVGLGKMSVRQYQGAIYSNWLSSLTNIVEISLSHCGSCRYLPPLERLPFLKSLEIKFFHELECIHFEEGLLVTFFPSLERLSFKYCEKFKGWCKMGDDVNDANCSHHLSLPSFPRLSQLSIRGCWELTHMPAFPNLDKRLDLESCPAETLEATINTECSVDYWAPLSMLKSLSIDAIQSIEEIPKDWMQYLTSLEHLEISSFGSQEFQVIETWFKDNLNYLPSLQKITLQRCQDLMELPDWMCNLSSLQHIEVYDCPNLEWLSGIMPHLTNLQTLKIIGCFSFLIEAYQTETSPLRCQIAHIPNIILEP